MGPRWKGKGSKCKALADPMSKIISEFRTGLNNTEEKGLLTGSSVLIEASLDQVELFNRACFGRLIVTAQKDTQWLQLGLDEAFYLSHSLRCLRIAGSDGCIKSDSELWHYMTGRVDPFPELYKAYHHLRSKNWVVKSGSQYGVDYVAYRHHPALVHSEYAVLVLSDPNDRLRVWSDLHCTIRVCGSVAKTWLLLYVQKKDTNADSPLCLDNYIVEERIVHRWNPERNREEKINRKTDNRAEIDVVKSEFDELSSNLDGEHEEKVDEKADDGSKTLV